MSEKMNNGLTYNLIEKLGAFTRANGDNVEVNIISWNGNQPKIDIRPWSADRKQARYGLTMTREEAEKMLEILQKYLDETK